MVLQIKKGLDVYTVKEIDASEARKIVKQWHYSGKVVANSKIHLGVFKENNLVGCLQYGPPMNGKKTSDKILKDVEMMELNRMVMIDSEPRNSESQAIAACNKWLRKNTAIKYILSFSDGKEGNVGYIYQATNWKYIGYILSNSFYELDGNYMHAVSVWHKYKEKHALRDECTTNEILCRTFRDVSIVTCKQHVYILELDKRIKIPFDAKPYPKKDKEVKVLRRKVLQDKEGTYLPSGKLSVYTDEVLESVF